MSWADGRKLRAGLLVAYKEHADDPRIPEVCADMAAEMGEGKYYPDLLARMAQFELTRWIGPKPARHPSMRLMPTVRPAFPSQ